MATTDAILLEQWTVGCNAEAFRELVGRHASMVFATAYRILGDRAHAEDVAQDCFLKLVETPRKTPDLSAWLHRVARNRSLDVLRSERRRREHEARWSPPGGPAAESRWEDVEALVDDAIDGLPGELRSAIVLHFLCGRSHEETAVALGISKSTVAYRVAKGIERIRAQLVKRGIRVAPAVLAGWLATNTAEAMPEALIASLGKVALAGPPDGLRVAAPSALKASLLIGGIMKVYVPIAAGLVIIAVCVYLIVKGGPGSVAPPAAPPARIVAKSELPSPPLAKSEAAKEAAPAPASVPEKKEEPPASVAGRVLDEEDTPIADADVAIFFHPPRGEKRFPPSLPGADWFRRSRSLYTATDASGAFRFDGIPFSGEATVCAGKEGFCGAVRPVWVAPGSTTEGVELKLPPGKTLRGVILDEDGAPVTDAIVTVCQAWNPGGTVPAGGAVATDGEGRFEVGMDAKAEKCDLLVYSDSLGQDFFLRIPVTDEEVQLEMKARAILRGRITWEDGTPAEDVIVQLSTQVPDPDTTLMRLGFRPRLRNEAALDADGRYEMTGLQPGLSYNALVIRASGDRDLAERSPLTPDYAHVFTFSPGEEKTWDEALAHPIVIRGTVKTEVSRTPIQGLRIGVRKNGNAIQDPPGDTNAEGVFEIVLNTGPGRYLLFARQDFMAWHESVDAIAERFGKTYDLRGGDEIEADLLVFEPIVLPFRVIGSDGKPLQSINYELGFQTPNGRRFGCNRRAELDAEGRTSLKLYTAVKEITLYVSPSMSPPRTAERVFHPEPGTVLPEETFTIDRTCDVTGSIVDVSGRPLAEQNITFEATYDDNMKDSSTIATDKSGRFELKGQLRAKPMTLRIRGEHGGWKGEGLDASAGSLDLGQVVLDPARAEKR